MILSLPPIRIIAGTKDPLIASSWKVFKKLQGIWSRSRVHKFIVEGISFSGFQNGGYLGIGE
eukprot:TRINITY_DN4288_c0_g1_i1.p2 TRINITY_DN4288_c0_g1~~TRINITY_DN4288_c0_g1_i1.p2  ORF type:complete len:62 (-),score=5.55 TRINITY_DN4288_c0_g1_i1:30-215(-)